MEAGYLRRDRDHPQAIRAFAHIVRAAQTYLYLLGIRGSDAERHPAVRADLGRNDGVGGRGSTAGR